MERARWNADPLGRRLRHALPRARWIALLLVARLSLAQEATPDPPTWEYDRENARDIMGICAACHGGNAEGGKGGTYPRLAGMQEAYIAKQLRAFKRRERINISMYPYATERELPETDILDIARLISEIELPTELPPPDATLSAYERLRAAQAVFVVPDIDGDLERGAALYEEECSECHGLDGWGEDDAPQLAGQYTEYLRTQIKSFLSGSRVNDDMEGILEELDADDLQNLLAHLAAQD